MEKLCCSDTGKLFENNGTIHNEFEFKSDWTIRKFHAYTVS